MKEIKGLKWKELTKELQEELLSKATAIDGSTGNAASEDGECIVDLVDTYSISGKIENGEIFINNEAIIYDSTEGIID